MVLMEEAISQPHHLITLDMRKVFKKDDNKLDFCRCCQWF